MASKNIVPSCAIFSTSPCAFARTITFVWKALSYLLPDKAHLILHVSVHTPTCSLRPSTLLGISVPNIQTCNCQHLPLDGGMMEQSVLIGPISLFPNSPFSFLLRAQLPFSCSFPAWPPQVRATGITVQLQGDKPDWLTPITVFCSSLWYWLRRGHVI